MRKYFELLQFMWTPLHFAACECHLDCLKELIVHNANVNLLDKGGETALHQTFRMVQWTPQRNRIHCVKALIEGGTDPKIRSKWGQTALDQAISSNQTDCVEYLKSLTSL